MLGRAADGPDSGFTDAHDQRGVAGTEIEGVTQDDDVELPLAQTRHGPVQPQTFLELADLMAVLRLEGVAEGTQQRLGRGTYGAGERHRLPHVRTAPLGGQLPVHPLLEHGPHPSAGIGLVLEAGPNGRQEQERPIDEPASGGDATEMDAAVFQESPVVAGVEGPERRRHEWAEIAEQIRGVGRLTAHQAPPARRAVVSGAARD